MLNLECYATNLSLSSTPNFTAKTKKTGLASTPFLVVGDYHRRYRLFRVGLSISASHASCQYQNLYREVAYAMIVGLLGYPITGKTTLFEAVCGAHHGADVGSVIVPDARFDYIVSVTKPKKVTPHHIEFQDNAARIEPGEHRSFSTEFFSNARKMDLLLHVVRGFESPYAPYHETIDPLRDQRRVEEELILADLQIVENRMERLQKMQVTHQSGTPEQNEWRILEHLKAELESNNPIRLVELGKEEEQRIRGFQFLSGKPVICAVNIDEASIEQGEASELLEPLKKYCEERHIPLVALSADIEKEIAQLAPEDRTEFLESMGIKAPAAYRLIRAVYEALGLITFFTVGESEVHAWPLRRGETSVDAAGEIHSDLARGFIRAEVITFKDLEACGGYDNAVKSGKMRLEGKEYIVQDGEIVHIRFKV
jgi:GTP-binding protein YchF